MQRSNKLQQLGKTIFYLWILPWLVILLLLSGGIYILYGLFWLIIISLAIIITCLIIYKLYRFFYRIFTGKDFGKDKLNDNVDLNAKEILEFQGIEDFNKYFYKELKMIYRQYKDGQLSEKSFIDKRNQLFDQKREFMNKKS